MRSVVVLAFVFAFLSPVAADHCESYTTSEPEISAADRYVDIECIQGKCLFSIWVYEESNGIPGLQRADEVVDDTCHGAIRGDTIIF